MLDSHRTGEVSDPQKWLQEFTSTWENWGKFHGQGDIWEELQRRRQERRGGQTAWAQTSRSDKAAEPGLALAISTVPKGTNLKDRGHLAIVCGMYKQAVGCLGEKNNRTIQ